MTESAENEPVIKRAFISGKTDNDVLGYFNRRRKKGFLRKGEKIAEIDRRYFPVGRFHIKNVREDVESKDYVYVNLNNGELYHVKNHEIKSESSVLSKILELPEDARKDLFNLMDEGSMDVERLSGKDTANILERKCLARVYITRKPSLFNIVLDEVSNILKTAATDKAVTSSVKVVEQRRIRKKIEKLKINKSHNLENFLDTRIPDSGFDADSIVYKPRDIIDVLARLLKRDVVYEESIYMPHYKCKYVTKEGARYIEHISPKFRE